jgi:hypothetical protein
MSPSTGRSGPGSSFGRARARVVAILVLESKRITPTTRSPLTWCGFAPAAINVSITTSRSPHDRPGTSCAGSLGVLRATRTLWSATVQAFYGPL